MSRARSARSPLSLVDEVFHRLTSPPTPLCLDAAELGIGSPGMLIPLDQLRVLLRRRSTPVEVKNRAWVLLCERAHHHGSDWIIAAVGVALPRLVRLASELAEGNTVVRAELDSEILTGFLAALAHAHTATTQRFPVLLRAARAAGLAWIRGLRTVDIPRHDVEHDVDHDTATPMPASGGHPDLVVADAVRAGVLTAAEAAVIIATRLDGQPLRVVAAQLGVSSNTVWARRDRAEKRLVAALRVAATPDDTDRRHDPTHARVLAATPLAKRIRLTRALRAPAPPQVPPHGLPHAPGAGEPVEDPARGKPAVAAPWYPQHNRNPRSRQEAAS